VEQEIAGRSLRIPAPESVMTDRRVVLLFEQARTWTVLKSGSEGVVVCDVHRSSASRDVRARRER